MTEIDSVNYRFCIDGRLPIGIRVREDIKVVPIDATRCRVNYNCDFTLPLGVRCFGYFCDHGFDRVSGHSLSRLKREAERVIANLKRGL